MGFRVWGLGFGVWGLGVSVLGLGFGTLGQVWGAEFRGLGVQGTGITLPDILISLREEWGVLGKFGLHKILKDPIRLGWRELGRCMA